MIVAYVATWLLATATVAGTWGYFRRWALTRPPLGTVNLGDIAFTLGCIVALPLLYQWLPGWLVGTFLALTTLSMLWFLVEPVTPWPVVRWGAAGGLVATDVILAWQAGTSSTAFLLVNDAVIVLVAVGVSVLWAQGGLRARDLAILAGAIAMYDLVATGFLPLTTEMIERLAGMPFLPMAVWPVEGGQWVGIGLGDLLMASVGPLVMRKAFGRSAGLIAMTIALAAIAVVMAAARWDAMPETFPTMIVLGPLMIAQYVWWAARRDSERTTREYLAAEPSRGSAGRQASTVAASDAGLAPAAGVRV
jgi:hypothetical protein